MTSYLVYVDVMGGETIEGWISDPTAPEHRAEVILIFDGEPLVGAVCDRYRPDVVAAGIGDGHYGYCCTPPHGFEVGKAPVQLLVDGHAWFDVAAVGQAIPRKSRSTSDATVEATEIGIIATRVRQLLFGANADSCVDKEGISVIDILAHAIESEEFVREILPGILNPSENLKWRAGHPLPLYCFDGLRNWILQACPASPSARSQISRNTRRDQCLLQLLGDPFFRLSLPMIEKVFPYENRDSTMEDLDMVRRLAPVTVEKMTGRGKNLQGPLLSMFSEVVADAVSMMDGVGNPHGELHEVARQWLINMIPLSSKSMQVINRATSSKTLISVAARDPLLRLLVPNLTNVRLPGNVLHPDHREVSRAYGVLLNSEPNKRKFSPISE